MPHLHDLIDFTVGAFIVENAKVLLIHHKKLKQWLCPGGHVELHEDPEEAIHREIKEETGLEIRLIGERSEKNGQEIDGLGAKSLIPPRFLDIHPITDTHRHVGMFWLARRVYGDITLATAEHHDIGWFSLKELPDLKMLPLVEHYATAAIREMKHGMEVGRKVIVVKHGPDFYTYGEIEFIIRDQAVVRFGGEGVCKVFYLADLIPEEKVHF